MRSYPVQLMRRVQIHECFLIMEPPGDSFPSSIQASPPGDTVTGFADTQVTAVLTNLSQLTTYYYRVRAESEGGTGISDVGTFKLDGLSGLNQMFPGEPPEAQGFVVVTVTPAGIASGWRFVGEQQWRCSGCRREGWRRATG